MITAIFRLTAPGIIWRITAGAGNRSAGSATIIIRGVCCDLATGGIVRAGAGAGFPARIFARELALGEAVTSFSVARVLIMVSAVSAMSVAGQRRSRVQEA